MAWTIEERFNQYISPEPMSGCWLWTGAVFRGGYGSFRVRGRIVSAHRVAWELWRNPIPVGACVLHRCDNRACVNPAHLWIGTKGQNNTDRHAKGRDVVPHGWNIAVPPSRVEEIRRRFVSGVPARALATEFGCCMKTIRRIAHGRMKYAVGR